MPDFNTANRRPPLCADSRLPLLIKLERERKGKKTRRLKWTLFSCFPPGKHQTVECVIWRFAVCNRLRSHLFLFWSRLRSLVCLVSLFHPAGSQVPIMPIKTVSAILSACRISVSLHTWDYLSFFPQSMSNSSRGRETLIDKQIWTCRFRQKNDQKPGLWIYSPISETGFWYFLNKMWVALIHCHDATVLCDC